MIQFVWKLAVKIPEKEILIIGFIILAFHQLLKLFLHEINFYYDKKNLASGILMLSLVKNFVLFQFQFYWLYWLRSLESFSKVRIPPFWPVKYIQQ